MPEITEEEYREYIYLKRKEAERQARIKELIELGPKGVKKWRTDLNTMRGYASVFANVLEKEWRKRNKPKEFVLDRWSVLQNYMPDNLLCIKKGKPNIKHTFRGHLRDFGWSFKINYKRGIFIVKKL